MARTEHRLIRDMDQGDYGPCYACSGTSTDEGGLYHTSDCPLYCRCDECVNADDNEEKVL